MIRFIVTLLLFNVLTPLQSQSTHHKKGDWLFYWGWNRSAYAKSDVHLKGDDYAITLKNVVAHDRQSKELKTFINPSTITIPQFNCRIGYFFKNNWAITAGWDHMKYVMDTYQVVEASGTIGTTISSPTITTSNYAGTYNNTPIAIQPSFLTFEHTDGLNYACVEIAKYHEFYTRKKLTLSYHYGGGVGLFVPRTDVRLFGVGKNNYWNVAGMGISAKGGIECLIGNHFFIQTNAQLGAAYLPSIRTTGRKGDSASQNIQYVERYAVFGVKF